MVKRPMDVQIVRNKDKSKLTLVYALDMSGEVNPSVGTKIQFNRKI